jgi:hypothetical protein
VSTTAVIIIVAAVALIAVIATRNSGPRVTQIDRTISKKDKDSGDA